MSKICHLIRGHPVSTLGNFVFAGSVSVSKIDILFILILFIYLFPSLDSFLVSSFSSFSLFSSGKSGGGLLVSSWLVLVCGRSFIAVVFFVKCSTRYSEFY